MELILGIVFFLSGYANGLDMTIGAGFHDEALYNCEYNYRLTEKTCTRPVIGGNPAGILKIKTSPMKNLDIVGTHITSIPDAYDDGFNIISIEYTIPIFKGKR